MKKGNMQIRRIENKLRLMVTSSSRMEKVEKLLRSGLPKQMESSLEYLVTGKCDENTDAVVRFVEARRQEIASQGDKEVPIWYSPKPGSAGTDASVDSRPEPVKTLHFTMERVAATGKHKGWGIVL